MASSKFAIGFVGVVVVALANVATTWAQSDELPRRVRERIGRTLIDEGIPSTAAAFGTRVKLTGSDETPNESFAGSLSVSGDVAIVGASHGDGNEDNSGVAYLFRRDEGGVNHWGEVAKIAANDGAAGDEFGQFVSISGDTAIVAAWGDDENGTDSGSAYIFQRDAGGVDNWGQIAKITANDAEAQDNFGSSVAIDGGTAIVGAYRDHHLGLRSGSAYIFQRDEGGVDNWGQQAKVIPSNGGFEYLFGNAVAISGDTAIVGAYRHLDGAVRTGAAFVFRRDEGGIDNWGEVARIIASDAAEEDSFGWSVAIGGDTAIVGAADDDDSGDSSGSAYVYQRNEGGADNWGQVTKIIASGGGEDDRFGRSVAVSGDMAIVGPSGRSQTVGPNGSHTTSAHVYWRDEGGTDNWGEVATIKAREGNSIGFGSIVATDGDTVTR